MMKPGIENLRRGARYTGLCDDRQRPTPDGMILRSTLSAALCASVLALGCQPADSKADGASTTTTDTKTTTPEKKEPAVPAPGDIPAPADVAAPPADAEKTPSGLASKVLQPGKGTQKPTAEDSVEVHYSGWTTDGKMFDSSVKRGRTASFPLNAVIAGWTEGLQLMVEGEKRRLWIPEELAYKGRPGKPAGMLVFDVELVKITAMPKTPEDVAAAPATAKKTASGLAYKAIKEGPGGDKPTAADTVEVHYAGWTTDGKLFDASYKRGQTAKFPLGGVIPGWTEGLQLMRVGDTYRFWIPGKLAYGDTPTRPGAPAGTLVFDVELVSIQK
jgi:FKBP-type peptidyl-prolyl cis-trans isomerase